MDWQPIETAPRNGNDLILLFRPGAHAWGMVAPGKFNKNEYAKCPRPYWEIWLKIGGVLESRDWEPTHWMPLPAPPKPQDAP